MPVPQLTEADIARALPSDIENIHYMTQGGQKVVFSCQICGSPYVIKFLLAGEPFTSRARREVDTMANCDVPTLVRLGPIALTDIEINGQPLLYFSEEKIQGKDLKEILEQQGTLPINDVIRLGCDIARAIESIWNLRRVHRDIKPGNIMRRDDIGDFVLLDVGLVFDLNDVSLTETPFLVGTTSYFSPEQMYRARRRDLDFRSDLFALGIVLYESATGQHPFAENCISVEDVWNSISCAAPQRPHLIRQGIPEELERVVIRLLEKAPHLRYNNCARLINDLENV